MAHVRKEGNTWYYYIDLGRDQNGKRMIKKKRGFKSEKEAKKALTEIMYEIDKGTYVEPSTLLFRDFLNQWLEHKEKIKKLKSTSLFQLRTLTRTHISPALGHIKLSDLNQLHIQSFLNDSIDKGLSDVTVQRFYTMINDALKYAVKFGLLSKNVCEFIERPAIEKKQMNFWNVDEVKQFLSVAKDERNYIVFHLALTTGMRQCEILGLTWDNVDLKKGLIYVRQQLLRNTKKFSTLKTKASNRNIAISDETIAILKSHKKRIAEERLMSDSNYTEMNLVCPTSNGTPYLTGNITKIFKRLIKKADVKEIRFHDLRHSFASLLLTHQNTNPKIIAEMLGHSNVRTTLDTYSHLSPNLQQETVKQFGNMLFGN
ncbi:site-specific integrase [Schinkia azotoformans]|uniref:site-specific integrase n=1 Tax=Schinkia azotoformans TaxID=1454 RepID=UPI002DB89BC0|nr:site-specific integrase [Schinkia azotoformans]MEC1697730.1 site-specific integrase [Schinkia azotoformans]